jgi:hypothetical protein
MREFGIWSIQQWAEDVERVVQQIRTTPGARWTPPASVERITRAS